jgi:glycosyltransferase involved in cell wall biosynthesis
MKVALMGRSLRGRFTGVVRYTDELIRALAPHLARDLTVFLTRSPDGLDGLPISRIRAPFPTRSEYARAFWEQCVVPVQVERSGFDVFHSPNYILPLGTTCPCVVTIHDLAFLDRSLHRLRSHLYLSALTKAALGKASRIICVSAYTRDRLLERFPAVADRARVIEEAVDGRFSPRPDEEVERFRARYRLEGPYVLFVGTIEPRKNLDRLIRAFGTAVASSGAPHDLVIAGGRGWKAGDVWRAFEGSPVRSRIRFLGYVPDAELPAAYTGADVFAYLSLVEGFGLPPLEAMACGTAVLTSNLTSLPEVVGGAALTVDPRDQEQVARGLVRLMGDPHERASMGAAGLARSRAFSWRSVAEKTLAVYAEAAA